MTLAQALAAIRALPYDVLVGNLDRLRAEADALDAQGLPIPQGHRDLTNALRSEFRSRTGVIL